MAQLMPLPLTVSCFRRLVLPVWYRLTRVVPEKGPLNVCSVVVVFVVRRPCGRRSSGGGRQLHAVVLRLRRAAARAPAQRELRAERGLLRVVRPALVRVPALPVRDERHPPAAARQHRLLLRQRTGPITLRLLCY